MAFSRTKLRKLAEVRHRPAAVKIGTLPRDLVLALHQHWEDHNHELDFAAQLQSRKDRGLPIEGAAEIEDTYSQLRLQYPKKGLDPKDTKSFTVPANAELVQRLLAITGAFYMARISALEPGAHVPEHIDDPEQIRVLAHVSGDHQFNITDKSGPRSIEMKQGELWFLNSAWPHSVHNSDDHVRLTLLLNMETLPVQVENLMRERADA